MRASSLRWLLVLVALALPSAAHAQVGRIVGRILDQATGSPIAGAQVNIADSPIRASSGPDGRYTLQNVPAGTVTVLARMIGRQPKTVSGVVVKAGEATELNVALAEQVIELEEVVVSAAAERGSVSAALEQQRVASQIVNSITAEQIAKSPDSDAGQAVQRVSGVTVQDGKYIFVRGLGERYTATSLNGSRLPSAEPERKVVPFDLFPSALLEQVTTSKTFTPDQPGDFSGAQVNIKTREFPAKRTVTFSVGSGFNTRTTFRDILRAPTTGTELLGTGGSDRALPDLAREAGFLQGIPQEARGPIVASFRNVWDSRTATALPNGSLGVSVGGEDPVFGQLIGYAASFTYSVAQEIREDEERSAPFPGARPGEVSAVNTFSGGTGRQAVLWGGLLNLSTRLGSHTRLFLNNTFSRSGDNEALRLDGFFEQNAQDLDITRLTFTQREVRSHQLGAEHLLGQRHIVDWSVGANTVVRDEPDRSDLIYTGPRDPQTQRVIPTIWFGSVRSATRTFSSIDERSYDAGLNYKLFLGNLARPASLKVGGYVRDVRRDADTRQFDIYSISLSNAERSRPATEIFDGTLAAQGAFLLTNNASGIYDATERLYAGYGMLEVPIGRRIRVIGGARVEDAAIDVNTTEFLGITPRTVPSALRNTDVLPSLAVTVETGASHQLRLSATQTLARPEYRELSPVNYFDILGGQRIFGNPDLQRTLIQNYDARFELYPRGGEVVSVGLFYKRFDAPIERVLQQNADGFSPDISFVNANSANNFGVELELRKQLDFLGRVGERVQFFGNLTLMQSEIDVANTGLSSLTNPNRPMVGQSGYVVNAGLGIQPGERSSLTILYNVAGRRIFEAGIFPFPDAYEEPRDFLDVSFSTELWSGLGLKLDARNLLDAPYRITQGGITRLRYLQGRVFQVGFKWTT